MNIDLRDALRRIKRLCQKQGVSYLVTRDPASIRYLTGCMFHAPGDAFVLVRPTSVVVFTDARYEGTVQKIAAKNPLIKIFIWDRFHPFDDICRFVRPGSVVGIEKANSFMNYKTVLDLRKAAQKKDISTKAVADILVVVRSIKYSGEIKLLQKAFELGDEAYRKILKHIRPGVTELEISQTLGRYLRELSGEEDLSFATIVASGPNSGIPHATPGRRKLRKGDAVTLDFGCVYEGYHSDMTRTVFVGEPCAKLRDIYQLVLAAQHMAELSAAPGLTGQEIDKAARDVIVEAGYGKYFTHSTGHGVGLDIHEKPHVTYARPGNLPLEPGMVFSIEPGIYLPDKYGVRIENVVLITETGCQVFNQVDKGLLVL